MKTVSAWRPSTESPDEVVFTREGYAELEEEHRRLTTVKRPEAEARLKQALQIAGDLADNSEYLDTHAELDLIDERIRLVERRLYDARVLGPDEASSDIVSLGSHVVIEDLDERTREDYVLVSSAESNPAQGRLSNESPVGRAISGHHKRDVVASHHLRHLRIVELHAKR